jgi:hypothetical protein
MPPTPNAETKIRLTDPIVFNPDCGAKSARPIAAAGCAKPAEPKLSAPPVAQLPGPANGPPPGRP